MANSANSLNIKSAGIPVFDGTATFTESTTTQYNVLVGGTANSIANVAPSATSGVPLISGGSSANPSFGTAVVAGGGTGAVTFTANGVLLGNTTSAITATAAGTTGQVLTGVTGSAPTFQSPAASSISITGDSGGALTGNAFTFTGGTTGLTFAGATSTETLGGTLVVSNGGTGIASATAYAVLCGGTTSTGAFQSIAGVGSSGQVLTSNGAGALPTFQAAASGLMTWTEVTGTSASMAINNGYIANNAGLVTLTLPSTAALGSVINVTGKGAGGWRIAQNSGQTIFFGTSSTTAGATGRLDSTATRDTIELVCVTANNDWNVLSSIGNITVT